MKNVTLIVKQNVVTQTFKQIERSANLYLSQHVHSNVADAIEFDLVWFLLVEQINQIEICISKG